MSVPMSSRQAVGLVDRVYSEILGLVVDGIEAEAEEDEVAAHAVGEALVPSSLDVQALPALTYANLASARAGRALNRGAANAAAVPERTVRRSSFMACSLLGS